MQIQRRIEMPGSQDRDARFLCRSGEGHRHSNTRWKKNLGTHMSTGEKDAQKESHISIKITVEFDAIILLS